MSFLNSLGSSSGSKFHTVGPATANDRRPLQVCCGCVVVHPDAFKLQLFQLVCVTKINVNWCVRSITVRQSFTCARLLSSSPSS